MSINFTFYIIQNFNFHIFKIDRNKIQLSYFTSFSLSQLKTEIKRQKQQYSLMSGLHAFNNGPRAERHLSIFN